MQTNIESIVITEQDLQRLRPLLEQSDPATTEQLDWEVHRATIIEQHRVESDVVTMNSEVVYEDLATGMRRTVRIVFPKDADASRGWVSVLAPIGSALLGLKVGQQIDLQLPAGRKRVFLAEVRYQPESQGDFHL